MAESESDFEMRGEKEVVASTSTSAAKTIEHSRRIQDFSVLGNPCVLNENKLPTKLDVLRRIFLDYIETEEKKGSMHSQPLYDEVAKEIANIWNKTKIPIIKHKSIKDKIHRLIDEYQNKDKNKKREAFEIFIVDSLKLFDIACWRCARIPSGCKCRDQLYKIPQAEIGFISINVANVVPQLGCQYFMHQM